MSDPIAAQEDSLDQTKAHDARQAARARAYRRARTISVIGTFGVLSLGCIYIAQDLLFPITLAFLLSLVFSPVVRTFARVRIPRVLTAFAIVLGLTATAIAGVYGLSGPVSGWIDEAPQIERQLRLRLADLGEPLDKLRDAQQKVSNATDQNNEGDDVQKVVVAEPNLISQAAQGAPGIATGIALMLVLLLFILSGGDLVYEKMVRALPTFGDRRKGLRIAHDVERALEGQLITPALVGNRLRINSIAIILAIAFWGWLWGFVGVLVAVPLLIVTSVIANHVEGLGGLRELLGPHVKAP